LWRLSSTLFIIHTIDVNNIREGGTLHETMSDQDKDQRYWLSQLPNPGNRLHNPTSQPAHKARKENGMKHFNAIQKQTIRHILLIAFIASLVVTSMAALPQPAYAQITPPPVPENIQVPEGNELFLVGHAEGTQNYVCLPVGPGVGQVAFRLFTPQATLFDAGEQIITHFFGPNPAENGTIRAAWQDSVDTSTVWAEVKPGNASTDPKFVAPGAVAWLLLTRAGSQNGPTGGDTLTGTTFIQRLNTTGGVAPSTDCTLPTDIGNQKFVPYTADYFFFRKAESN
jgi:hypothetical protein